MTESNKRHHIIFQPGDIEGVVPEGQALFESARELGLPLRSDCGGKGLCGKCRVRVTPGENLSVPTAPEVTLLAGEEASGNWRLACQAMVLGPVIAHIPAETNDQGLLEKGVAPSLFPLDPAVKRLLVDWEGQKSEDGADKDLASLMCRCSLPANLAAMSSMELSALRALSAPDMREGNLTVVRHDQFGATAVLRGRRDRSLGVALDVGTTTLASYLCDLGCGRLLASAASLNPQRIHGEDVISRIAFANDHPSGANLLHRLVIDDTNVLIARCLEAVGAAMDEVDEITVVGNTTMQHLFMGLHPHSLGIAPYLPVTCSAQDVRAADLGLRVNPAVNVHIFPVISGFVGGDTIAAILAERPHERQEITLILDIGTNGELVIGNHQAMWATSCATGPAFEGAHISCGMRAIPGAIHKVSISPGDWTVAYEVLNGRDGTLPRGLCGSGVIAAVAQMRRAGLLRSNGRIREGMPGVTVDEQGVGRRFLLVPAPQTATGRDIYLTLLDIRQIQLAKAALSSGITLLLHRTGIGSIDRLVLTGSFGARLDWQDLVAIGMIPDSLEVDHVDLVENAAGIGAIQALLDKGRRREAQRVASSVGAVELADETDFMAEFARAMSFPRFSRER